MLRRRAAGAKFDVLLYDLTSTYFESDVQRSESDLRQYGYSRDKRRFADALRMIASQADAALFAHEMAPTRFALLHRCPRP